MQAANVKTELVDWKILDGQTDRSKSDDLMRHVATLFSLTAKHCTKEQIETYDIVLQRLADLVNEETRSFAAQKICALDNAPHDIVRRFAFDVISVADPVLRHSPVLTDDDLIEVSQAKGESHMVAICMRKTLSSLVTDVLIRSQRGNVLIKLASNSEAHLSEGGLALLKAVAANDQSLASELSYRAGQAKRQKEGKQAEEALIASVDLYALWKQIEPTVSESMYDLSFHSYLCRYKFNASMAKVERFHKQGLLDRGALKQFASNDQFADVVCGIARISGFPHQVVARMMSSMQWEQVLCLFKLLGFSDCLLRVLLECGPWVLCLSPSQCATIVKQYRKLTLQGAKSRALKWPQAGLLLD